VLCRRALGDRPGAKPRAGWCWLGAVLGCAPLLLLPGGEQACAAEAARAPRHLLIRVRDTPPRGAPAYHWERDGSYTVSTGGGGDRDDRASAGGADNSAVVSTTTSVRVVRVLEGESVRVDLPSVQSLQFHAPVSAGTATTPAAAGRAGSAPAASGAAPGTSAPASSKGVAPTVSGVVFFEAVSAFAARFALVGNSVRIQLVPLRTGGVAAPFAVAGGGEGYGSVTLVGRVGEWIALGDTELLSSGKSLSVTAEPPSQPSIWVRVEPDPADQP